MPARRLRLKRSAVWSAAIAMWLLGYVLGAPFVAYYGQRHIPAAEPFFIAVYAPLIYISREPSAPGHDLFVGYVGWCQQRLDELSQ